MTSERRYLFLPVIIFSLGLGIGGVFISLAERQRSAERHWAIREAGAVQAHSLKNHLDRVLSVTHAFAAIVRDRGAIENFDRLAAEMIKNYQSISTLQLAPDGVITQAYPPAPNEAAIGHDLLNDPRRRSEALLAIGSRALTLAGPCPLANDGAAITGLLPVFIQGDAGGDRFWGFTVVVISLPKLFEAINLQRLVGQDLHYALSRAHPGTGTRLVLTRSGEAEPPPHALPFEIEVPNETWTLAVWPQGGRQWLRGVWVEIALVLLASGLSAFITYRLARRSVRKLSATNRDLQAEIVRRERVEQALRENKERLRLLLETTGALPWEVNAKTWRHTYVGPQAVKLLGYPPDQWYGLDFWASHVYPKDRAHAIDQRLQSSKRGTDYQLEYRMMSADGRVVWLQDIVYVQSLDGVPELLRGFSIDITERKQAEEALRDLQGRLINAHEEAHERLGRELHDGLAQRLAALGIEAGKLEQDSGECPDFVRERVQGMSQQIVQLAEDIHRIARQLHPSILDNLGLADAIESECGSVPEAVSVRFTAARLPVSLPKDVSLCLYRVAQAGLSNIAAHARAKKAFVRLAGDDRNVSLLIQDDGIGFDPAGVQGKSGMGLVSMRERIRLLRGNFLLHSEPGQGTLIEVRVPLAGRDG